jgi:hypothetical protein
MRHTNTNPDSYSDAYVNGNTNTNCYGDSDTDGNCYCDAYSYSNSNTYADGGQANTDAQATPDAAAASLAD